MKPLPIGEQVFSELIKSDYLYVDKTEQLYNLVKRRGRYFLFRPRRFGKSLTCSTLDAIFNGDKELFKDLWISNSDYDWQIRPVIYFDFSQISHETPDVLERGLHNSLNTHAEKYRIVLKNTDLKEKFAELITTLGQTKNQVAVIIDEYDEPITSLINNPEQAEASQKKLESFYTTLKGKDVSANMHFLFITGVIKFSKMSLFSTLNNLDDLTNDNEACALVGYTDEEVDLYLTEHIQAFSDECKENYNTSRALLKTWYNGYRFSNKNVTVYNPFSVHNCLKKKVFGNFWFVSGTPKFLVEFIKKNPEIATDIETVDRSFISTSTLESFTIDLYYQKYKTLLLQTGYLTFVSEYDNNRRGYEIGYPNREVRYSMTKQIMEYVGGITSEEFSEYGANFRQALKDDNLELFCKHLQDFIRLIPHNIRVARERFYHSAFFMICTLFGRPSTNQVASDVATDKGFIDLLLDGTKNTFVVEFKLENTPEAALAQIEAKRYWEKYEILKTKKVVLAGITFNETNDGIVVLLKTKEL